jgi:hypothetical protein
MIKMIRKMNITIESVDDAVSVVSFGDDASSDVYGK